MIVRAIKSESCVDKNKMFEIGIQALAYKLGSRKEYGSDLVRDNPDWNLAEIEEKTGIKTRHLVGVGETAADLAECAARALFDRGIDPGGIGALIFVSQSPDYALPTTACLLQHRLGLPTNCMAFDVNLGCSGFVYGLGVSVSLIDSGLATNVLLLCSDTYSHYIGKNDRTCRPIFSDGGAAVLVGKGRNAIAGGFVFGSDGSGGKNLIVENSGGRHSAKSMAISSAPSLYMNGPQVFMFTMAAVPKLVMRILEASGTDIDEIDLFVFHQASTLVLENIARQLKLPDRKLFSNISHVGNTVSATIPIALADAALEGKLGPKKKILICGFGVGYSWGGAIIEWGADTIVSVNA